jgi:hypothetical protein
MDGDNASKVEKFQGAREEIEISLRANEENLFFNPKIISLWDMIQWNAEKLRYFIVLAERNIAIVKRTISEKGRGRKLDLENRRSIQLIIDDFKQVCRDAEMKLTLDACIRATNRCSHPSKELYAEDLETLLDELRKQPRTTRRERRIENCNELLKEFRSVKDLWRNRVMHARAIYNANQAQSAFNHVCNFIQKLSKTR